MELKPDIAKGLTIEEQERVWAALNELSDINEVRARFRVTQLKNALLVKSAEDLDD